MDIVDHSRFGLGQTTLSRVLSLTGKNGIEHLGGEAEQISGRWTHPPACLSAKPRSLRVCPKQEREGLGTNPGSNHRLGKETVPGHQEISKSPALKNADAE